MEPFSVLMSVYAKERPEFLDSALRSVFEQSVAPSEVVLVEDGPLTDALYEVVARFCKQYSSLRVVALPQNVGLGNALNAGLEACSFDLVARMDSDDISLPNRFEEQLKAFGEDPELAVVGAWVDEFEGVPEQIVSTRKLPTSNDEIIQYVRSRNPINHPSVMFRRSAVQSVGGYQHFYLFEDYYLWARMIKAGHKLANIPQSLLLFRVNPQMIKRRGGWKYAVTELQFFRTLVGLGIIGWIDLIKSAVVRFPVRIMPNKLRAFVYNKLLR